MNLPRETGTIPSDDGTHLYYEVFGHGRPLLLLGGLLCKRSHWRHQIQHFLKKFQVITFDYRGHGSSAYPSNDRHMTLEWCARDALAVARSLGLDEMVLFGHSMGVPIAAKAALISPSQVKAAVFVCGTVTNPFQSMFFTDRMNSVYRISDRLFQVAPGLMTSIWKKFTQHSRFSFFLTSQLGFNASLADEKDVLLYLEGVHSNRLDTFYQLLRDYTAIQELEWLENVKCPVLMIAGEDDCVTPLESLTPIRKCISSMQFESIAGGSHNAHADLPLIVNRRIEQFLEGLGYG